MWCPDREGLKNPDLIPDGLNQVVGGTLCQTRNGSDTVLRRDLDEGEYNPVSVIDQKLVYMPDQLGSVRDVIDATTGNLLQSYDYTPYGAVARSTGSSRTDFQFARLFAHPASGLNFATSRVQNGAIAPWLSRDALKELTGPNAYMYVKAKPISYYDPMGYCETVDCLEECISLLVDKVNDISPIITGTAGASLLGGIPIPKRLIGLKVLQGASEFTNPISSLGFQNPGAMMGRSELFGTRNLGYILGRANAWLASGIALLGTSAIIGCTYQCVEDQAR
jgi:RHS repeat-associated protein